MKRVTNILSKDTLFTPLLPWITEQKAFQKLLFGFFVWAESMKVCQKHLRICCFSPKTIADLLTLILSVLIANVTMSALTQEPHLQV